MKAIHKKKAQKVNRSELVERGRLLHAQTVGRTILHPFKSLKYAQRHKGDLSGYHGLKYT